MFSEAEFQRWSLAYQDSISELWRGTCPPAWKQDPGDYDQDQDRAAFRCMEYLREVHDGGPTHDDYNTTLGACLRHGWVVLTRGAPRLTPAGFEILAGHTLDRYLLLDWRHDHTR